MTDRDYEDKNDYEHKLDELDHLLNDLDVPLQPDRVWSLLAEISQHDLALPRDEKPG